MDFLPPWEMCHASQRARRHFQGLNIVMVVPVVTVRVTHRSQPTPTTSRARASRTTGGARLLAECTRLRCQGYKRLMCDLREQIESMRYGKDKSKEWLRRMLEMEEYSYASSEDEELE